MTAALGRYLLGSLVANGAEADLKLQVTTAISISDKADPGEAPQNFNDIRASCP